MENYIQNSSFLAPNNKSPKNSTVIIPIPNLFNTIKPNILNSSPTPPALDLASSTTNGEKKNSLTEASSAFRPLLNNNPNNTSFNDFLAIALNTLIPMSSPSVASSNCDGPHIDFSAESADSTSFNDSASATSSSASKSFYY